MRIRAGLLVGGTLAAVPVTGAVVVAPVALLGSTAGDAAARGTVRPLTRLPLDDLLAGLCGVVLLLALGAWTVGLLIALAEAAGPRAARAARAVPCPALFRALALGALGAGLAVAAPAAGDPPRGTQGAVERLVGLPLPDRVATAGGPRSRLPPGEQRSTTLVRPGDTLWSLARAALPAPASDAAVDRAWRRIAAANPDRVTDPHVIFPGTVLRVPPLDDLLGKDLP